LSKMPGGYLDGSGTPSSVLAFGLGETNEALAMMIQALKDHDIRVDALHRVSQTWPVADQSVQGK
jgi:hypothetical protein